MNIAFTLPVVSLIIKSNDSQSVLLQTRKKANDPFDGYYELPQGKIEKGELVLDAASRELFEETSLTNFELESSLFQDKIGTEKLQFFQTLVVSESGKASYLAICLIGTATGSPKSSDESRSPIWYSRNEIIQLLKQEVVFPLNVPMLKMHFDLGAT